MQNNVAFTRQTVDSRKLPKAVLEKWSPDVLSEGFVPFPKKLVRCLQQVFDSSDSVKEIAALLAVIDFKRPNLTRNPSLHYLAFLAGLAESDFDAALQRLRTKRYVEIQGGPEELHVSVTGLLAAIEANAK